MPTYSGQLNAAIQWNSPQILKLHAFRFFFGTTAAHDSNILVNADGNLFSVDHELVPRGSGADILELFRNIAPQTKAQSALAHITTLTLDDVRAAFDRLPSGLVWPLGDHDATVTYFLNRLRKGVNMSSRTDRLALRIGLDSCLFSHCLKEMQALFLNVPLELFDGLFGISDAPEKLFRFESDDGPATAGELRIVLKPTDFLLGYLSAIRAIDRDFCIVKKSAKTTHAR